MTAKQEHLPTIIILTRDRRDLLDRCITSIRRHTQEPYSIMVVDDHSDDDTQAWLELESLPHWR